MEEYSELLAFLGLLSEVAGHRSMEPVRQPANLLFLAQLIRVALPIRLASNDPIPGFLPYFQFVANSVWLRYDLSRARRKAGN